MVSVVSSVAAAKLVMVALVAALATALLGWTEGRGGVRLLPPSPAAAPPHFASLLVLFACGFVTSGGEGGADSGGVGKGAFPPAEVVRAGEMECAGSLYKSSVVAWLGS